MIVTLQALVGKAEALIAVLVAQAQLLTALAVEAALTQGTIEYTEITQPQVAAEAAQCQRIGRFGMAFQGKTVADAVTQAAGGDTRAVTEVLQAVVAAQRTGRHGKIA
ncbi:hypothetical protein D3C81_796000 [compost metagenome]